MSDSKTKSGRRSAAEERALKLLVVLSRALDAVSAHVHRDVARHGLSATEFGVLEALYHKGPLLQGEVQRKILLSSGGITYTVDRLVEKGLVERRDCASDRRARYAALTPKGEALMARIFPEHAAAVQRAVSGVPARDQETLIALLRTLGLGAAGLSADEGAEAAD